MRYLLVTHIPFVRIDPHRVQVDSLWARDLKATVAAVGSICVTAPEKAAGASGNSFTTDLTEEDGVRFVGLPLIASRRDAWKVPALKRSLERSVLQADVVHTSNYFPPYNALASAHDFASKLGKKTVFVIAEDFYDMFDWEWVRPARNSFDRWRRVRTLRTLDRRAKRSASTASITFLHTPAAVKRYRSWARNGIAIRQPAHDACDVVDAKLLDHRCAELIQGRAPLRLATASRHEPLKGLDYAIRALARLRQWGISMNLAMAGRGTQTEALQRLATQLGVAENVRFVGSLEHGAAVRDFLNGSDVFLMPHRTSDFGRSFFDAMAAGLPVIAFDSAASSGTVENGVDGLICPPDDVDGLAAALARLDSERSALVAMSRNARLRAVRNTATVWHELRASWIRELIDQEHSDAPRR